MLTYSSPADLREEVVVMVDNRMPNDEGTSDASPLKRKILSDAFKYVIEETNTY